MKKWTEGFVTKYYSGREVYHCETCEPEYRTETPYGLRQLFDDKQMARNTKKYRIYMIVKGNMENE